MRLIVGSRVFENLSQENALALADIFITVARAIYPHALLTDPPYLLGSDNGPIDVWLNSRSPLEASAFRSVLTTGLLKAAGPLEKGTCHPAQPRCWSLSGSPVIHVEPGPTSDWKNRHLSLPDTADLLREPVHLVLENARTDLAFVRLLAGPTHGATLQGILEQPGRVEVHGGGGGEGKKWIEEKLALAAPTSTSWRRLLRTWVLFDKDVGHHDAREISESALDLLKLCERVTALHGEGLSWICLLRREIESYVPDAGLLEAATDRQRDFAHHILAWRADPTKESWAWAVDLKKGLHGDRHPTWSQGLSETEVSAVKQGATPLQAHMLKAPFSTLSAADIGTLSRGLGDDLGKALRGAADPKWASDLPAEYDRGPSEQAPRASLLQSLFDRM